MQNVYATCPKCKKSNLIYINVNALTDEFFNCFIVNTCIHCKCKFIYQVNLSTDTYNHPTD